MRVKRAYQGLIDRYEELQAEISAEDEAQGAGTVRRAVIPVE